MTRLSTGAKASVVYVVSSLLAKGLAVLTLPIFTRIMPSDQIGLVNLFNSWQMMISGFATLSLTSGGFMLAMKDFSDDRDRYTSSVLSLTTAVAVVILALVMFFGDEVSTFTGLSFPLCLLMAVGFIFMPAFDFWLGRQRYEYHYKAVGALTIVNSVVSTAAALAAVLLVGSGGAENLGEVRIFAASVVTLAIAGFLWTRILVKGRTFYNADYWKYSLALSLPLVGNTIATQVLSVSDRVMISSMVGNYAVGIYGTLYSISSLILVFWNAINSSFVPFLYERADSADGAEEIRSASSKLLFCFAAATFLVALLAPEVVALLTTEEYYEAVSIVPPIIAGVYMTSVSNMYSNMLIYYKKTHFIMVSSISAAVLNFVLNLATIRVFGFAAAAYTTLVAYCALAVIQGVVSERVRIRAEAMPRVYDNRRIAVISLAVVCLCLACVPLYGIAPVRYGVLALLLVIAVIFRKRTAEVVRLVRG